MLYVCPTPIGNMSDITLRVLEVLGRIDIIACEDTRRTRVLLNRHGISARLLSFHEHNEAERIGQILSLLRAGEEIALVSDAGMPGLSDPGFTLVRDAVEEGIGVTVLPGPSSIPTALVASGLPTDRFVFIGFLPRGRRKAVAAVEEADAAGGSVVAFESPRRLEGTLEVLSERWPERAIAVCRELTKVHEQVIRGTAANVRAALAGESRGEIVLVLGPTPGRRDGIRTVTDQVPAEALSLLRESGLGTKDSARLVSLFTGVSRREAYRLLTERK